MEVGHGFAAHGANDSFHRLSAEQRQDGKEIGAYCRLRPPLMADKHDAAQQMPRLAA